MSKDIFDQLEDSGLELNPRHKYIYAVSREGLTMTLSLQGGVTYEIDLHYENNSIVKHCFGFPKFTQKSRIEHETKIVKDLFEYFEKTMSFEEVGLGNIPDAIRMRYRKLIEDYRPLSKSICSP